MEAPRGAGGPDASGTEVLSNDAEVVRRLDIDPATVSMFRQDLTLIPSMGTAQGAFADFGPGLEQVGGKTGTTKGTDTRDPTASLLEWPRWTTRATWW